MFLIQFEIQVEKQEQKKVESLKSSDLTSNNLDVKEQSESISSEINSEASLGDFDNNFTCKWVF